MPDPSLLRPKPPTTGSTMYRIILTVLALLAVTATASAQTIVGPKPHHHAGKAKGYLYVSEARYQTVRVVRKFSRREYGVYVVGACHRRSRLAVNCDVARSRKVDGVTEVCDFVSRVRERVSGGRSSWKTRLDLSGKGCHL